MERHFILTFAGKNSKWKWKAGSISPLLLRCRAICLKLHVQHNINQQLYMSCCEDMWNTFTPLSATRPSEQSTVEFIVLANPRTTGARHIHSLEMSLDPCKMNVADGISFDIRLEGKCRWSIVISIHTEGSKMNYFCVETHLVWSKNWAQNVTSDDDNRFVPQAVKRLTDIGSNIHKWKRGKRVKGICRWELVAVHKWEK